MKSSASEPGLTSHLEQNVGLGKGRWAVSKKRIMVGKTILVDFFRNALVDLRALEGASVVIHSA